MPRKKQPTYRPAPAIDPILKAERKEPIPFRIIRTEDIVLDEPRFSFIPPFIPSSNYQVDSAWTYVDHWLGDIDGILFDENPDFQRAHVWIESQQIRYLEFILRDGRSSNDIYWNCSTWGRGYSTPVVLVDGKQRIEAVRRFIHNEIKVFGYYYHEFTDKLPLHARFRMHVNDLLTRAEVLQWYLDLNSGGVVHTEDELSRVRALLEEELKNE